MISEETGLALMVNAQNMADAQKIINRINRQKAELKAEVDELTKYLNDLASQVRQLQLALAVEKAHAAGYQAYVKAAKSQHPDSPIFADSGQRYKQSGNVKSNGRLLYEAAFDAEARKLGLSNPAQYRAD